ncbi:MAG: oxidoreductase [Candidatus Paceibacterota bacterium]
MLKTIDNFLNRTTMYKVVLYYLMALWLVAFLFSVFNILPYTPKSMLLSLIILLATSWATNIIFSYIFEVPANIESIYISAFILALVITPAFAPLEYIFLGWVGVLAMASKYILAIKHKHVFNPVAVSLVITAFFLNQVASWWVGTIVMVPFVLVGGLMIIRKIKRTDLALSFFLTAFITILTFVFLNGGNVFNTLSKVLFYSPLLFFTFIMITEPLTTPPSRFLRILYGTLVGFLFAPQIHLGTLYLTPELALIFGNIFSYLVSPKKRLTLTFKKAIEIAPNTGEFIFETNMPFSFKPGQYLEWTLGHDRVDSRGNRRYFTIASSPTEKELLLGVKFYENRSSFKKKLAQMKKGDTIIASQLSGDFVMPKNEKKKLVFIAGGIGITPFRSMIKYLIDTKQTRDIVLIYANKTEADIVYKNILDIASRVFNLKVIYVISDLKDKAVLWNGRIGYVDEKMIREEVKDFEERTFYVSGPPSMVFSIEKAVKNLGLNSSNIKTDFFPGFA